MSFVRQHEADDDLFIFQHDFLLSAPEGKAVVTEQDDGDLLIEGWAAVFEGLDREGENFAPGAFKQGIKSFLSSQAALCFHHKPDHGIGKVLELEEHEGKGLYMKARVDYQPESSPLRYIYNAVKKGTYNGLSVGGFFKRLGQKIIGTDLTEISITPVPVHPGTSLSVLAGKALSSDIKQVEGIEIPKTPRKVREEDLAMINEALTVLKVTLDRLNRRGEKKDESLNSDSFVTPLA